MKVLDLRCSHDHAFEGWFASADDFVSQQERGLVECPLCGDTTIQRRPSAPRLNISGATQPGESKPTKEPGTAVAVAKPASSDLQTLWMQAVRHVMANTEDVGERFAEEARRIHYGEADERGIRGRASAEETEALREEGIEVMPLPIPSALKGPQH